MTAALVLFAAVNFVLLALTGVHTGGDTGLYLEGARRLLDGQPLVDRQPSYLGYVTVVAAAQALGVGLLGIVLVQIAVATLAAAAVYRMAERMGGGRAAALAVVLLSIDYETNQWHGYVLADSLYLSLFTLSVWLVHRAADGRGEWRNKAVATAALVVAALIRPEGWFVLPAAALYWAGRSPATRAQRLTASSLILVACVTVVMLAAPRFRGNISAVDPGEMLRRGQTIWDYDGWRLSMPDATADLGGASSATRAVRYALQHPVATVELMMARVGVHLVHVRPFYSTWHNLAIAVWLVPIYGCAAVAIWTFRRDPLTTWCAIAFGTQALVVALMHADWDGRYLAHVLPIVYPFAACGLVLVSRRRAARA